MREHAVQLQRFEMVEPEIDTLPRASASISFANSEFLFASDWGGGRNHCVEKEVTHNNSQPSSQQVAMLYPV